MSFLTKRPSRRTTVAGAVVLAAGMFIGYAGAPFAGDGIPANKVTAAGAAVTEATPTTPLLTATMRTSKPTDLILQVAAECAIESTFTRNGKTVHQEGHGRVRMWLTIDGPNNIVPIESASNPPQDPPAWGDDSDKVTFCERKETYDKHDGNTVCAEDTTPATIPPLGTAQCETERWFQYVKTANAFNWVRMNLGSGIHTIELHADVVETASSTTPGESQQVRALVGNRTLVIEPTKMANDAIIGPSGSS